MKALLIALLWIFTSATADERLRPSTSDQLDGKPQQAVRVQGARVSYANFSALRRDFPQLAQMDDAKVEAWILENFAYVSQEQLKLNGIRQSEIPVDATQTKKDHRPLGYGRAGVLEGTVDGKPVGLVDIKGLGLQNERADVQVQAFRNAGRHEAAIDAIRTDDHSDGLMRHGEAVAEVTRQTALQRLYDLYNHQHKTDYQTVESYFIIELPFDVLGPKGHKERAALYGRQAHWRGDAYRKTPADTYEDPFGHRQGSVFGSAVDFGGVLIQDPRLKNSFGVRPGGKAGDPQDTFVWARGHDEAAAFTAGDRGAIFRHLEEMLAPIDKAWKALPAAPPVYDGPQKKVLDELVMARHPRPDQIPELLRRMRDHKWNDPELALLIDAMNAATLSAVLEKRESLQILMALGAHAHFAPGPEEEKEPRAQTLLAALMKFVREGGSEYEARMRAATFAYALVERVVSPARRAEVKAQLAKEYSQAMLKDAQATRDPRERLRVLKLIAEHGTLTPGFSPLAQEALLTQDGREDRGLYASDLVRVLLEKHVPAAYEVLEKIYPQLAASCRLMMAQHYGGLQPPRPGAAAILRRNMSSYSSVISVFQLNYLVGLHDPETRGWILSKIAEPGLDSASLEHLLEASQQLGIGEEELAPSLAQAFRNGTPDLALGRTLSRTLLQTEHAEARPAVEAWLKKLGNRGRRELLFAGNLHPWVTEQVGKQGVRITCAQVWGFVRRLFGRSPPLH